MSMLAEKKRKCRIGLNPRGNLWANDEDKFGQKLLEKMGWKKGKGLGKNEQGERDPVRVRSKSDNKGVGFKDDAEEWTKHYDAFEDVLANLNDEELCNNTNESSVENNNAESLETKSKASKNRVHYHKFTRGKDLSRYNEDDLACVLGSKRSTKKNETKDPVEVQEEVGEATSSGGLVSINGGSLTDYFNKKMEQLKRSRDHGLLGSSDANSNFDTPRVTRSSNKSMTPIPDLNFEPTKTDFSFNVTMEEAETVQQNEENDFSDRKKRKKKKRKEETKEIVEENKENEEVNLKSEQNIENDDEYVMKTKKKKCKKEKVANFVSSVSLSIKNHDCDEISIQEFSQKKKKQAKLTQISPEKDGISDVEEKLTSTTKLIVNHCDEASAQESSKKKSKRKKLGKILPEEDSKSNVEEQMIANNCDEASVQKNSKKKKKQAKFAEVPSEEGCKSDVEAKLTSVTKIKKSKSREVQSKMSDKDADSCVIETRKKLKKRKRNNEENSTEAEMENVILDKCSPSKKKLKKRDSKSQNLDKISSSDNKDIEEDINENICKSNFRKSIRASNKQLNDSYLAATSPERKKKKRNDNDEVDHGLNPHENQNKTLRKMKKFASDVSVVGELLKSSNTILKGKSHSKLDNVLVVDDNRTKDLSNLDDESSEIHKFKKKLTSKRSFRELTSDISEKIKEKINKKKDKKNLLTIEEVDELTQSSNDVAVLKIPKKSNTGKRIYDIRSCDLAMMFPGSNLASINGYDKN